MLRHDRIGMAPDEPVIFAFFPGFSCSICAPDRMTEADIVAFADQKTLDGYTWRIVDKSTIGLGSPTPNPCNQVDGRRHWFLLIDK